jgi:hypothetical protein
MYAERVLANGAIAAGWPINGQKLSTYLANQYDGDPVADNSGGVYILFSTENGSGPFNYIQHLTGNAQIAPGWTTNGLYFGADNGYPRVTTDGAGGMIGAWGSYGIIRAQRFVPGGIVATALSLASVDARSDAVTLRWQGVGAGALTASVYRRTESAEWQRLGDAEHDGSDRLAYEDRSVTAGGRYAYRLGWNEQGADHYSQESWVDVPATATLSLEGLRPNPAVDALNVSFSLPSPSSASVELLDVTGRRVLDREVGSLGAGRHLVRLDNGSPVAPGMYWLRLRQGERSLMARAVVVR